jgi:hypothetical protein
MTHSKHEDKLAKYKDMKGYYSTPPETIFAAKKIWVEQRKWDIPDTFVIKVASVGAFIMREDNPNPKYTTEEIKSDILESIEAGACAFHTHVRDSQGRHTLDVGLYHEVINPIKENSDVTFLYAGVRKERIRLQNPYAPYLSSNIL